MVPGSISLTTELLMRYNHTKCMEMYVGCLKMIEGVVARRATPTIPARLLSLCKNDVDACMAFIDNVPRSSENAVFSTKDEYAAKEVVLPEGVAK